MPASEVGAALLLRSLLGPAIAPPVIALDHTDEVQKSAPPQGICDDVATGAVPVGPNRAAELGRQAFQGYNAAPSHKAGELRLSGPEHVGAQARMHPIGTDDQVALFATAGVEFEHRA